MSLRPSATTPVGTGRTPSRAGTDRPTATSRTTQAALLVGAMLSLVAGLAVLIDQLGADSIWRHLKRAYPAGYSTQELADDKSSLVTVLYVLAVLAVLSWWVSTVLVRRRNRWARAVATTLFVIGAVSTTAGLWVSDEGYGRPLPTWLALVFAAPAIAGLVAVVAIWRRPRH